MFRFMAPAFVASLALAPAASAEQFGFCDVGKCELQEAPEQFLVGGARLAGFYVTRIENAEIGPHAGTFNFVSSVALRQNGKLAFYLRRSFLGDFDEDLFLTVYYPASVAGTSANIGTEGSVVGQETMVELDLSAAANQTVFYEIQGAAKGKIVDDFRPALSLLVVEME